MGAVLPLFPASLRQAAFEMFLDEDKLSLSWILPAYIVDLLHVQRVPDWYLVQRNRFERSATSDGYESERQECQTQRNWGTDNT